jgi:hypothetical protein
MVKVTVPGVSLFGTRCVMVSVFPVMSENSMDWLPPDRLWT